jgi:hypothetical protein
MLHVAQLLLKSARQFLPTSRQPGHRPGSSNTYDAVSQDSSLARHATVRAQLNISVCATLVWRLYLHNVVLRSAFLHTLFKAHII